MQEAQRENEQERGEAVKKRRKKREKKETLVHIHSAYWHATKAISQLNLYGSILAVPHINDDCWSALLECSNFITSIPNQFSPPDTNNTTLRRSSLSH